MGGLNNRGARKFKLRDFLLSKTEAIIILLIILSVLAVLSYLVLSKDQQDTTEEQNVVSKPIPTEEHKEKQPYEIGQEIIGDDFTHENLIYFASSSDNKEDIKKVFNIAFNLGGSPEVSGWISQAVDEYYNFPFVKSLGTSTAVFNPSMVGDPAFDIEIPRAYTNRTPEYVDFHGCVPDDIPDSIEEVLGVENGMLLTVIRGTNCKPVDGSSFYFSESYPETGDFKAEKFFWTKAASKPDLVRLDEFLLPEYFKQFMSDRFKVASFEDLDIKYGEVPLGWYDTLDPRYYNWELQSDLYGGHDSRDGPIENVFIRKIPVTFSSDAASLELKFDFLVLRDDPSKAVPYSYQLAKYQATSSSLEKPDDIEVRFDNGIKALFLKNINLFKLTEPAESLNNSEVAITLQNEFGADICRMGYEYSEFDNVFILFNQTRDRHMCQFDKILHGSSTAIRAVDAGSSMNKEYLRIKQLLIGELARFKFEVGGETYHSKFFDFRLAGNTDNDVNVTFYDPATGIAFEYPVKWGPVIGKDAMYDRSQDVVYRYYSFNFNNLENRIFLAVANEVTYPERGAFWGDSADQITADYLRDCAEKDTCTTITNKYGVTFAKDRDSHIQGYGDEFPVTNMYDLYNTDNEFYGVKFSSTRLPSELEQEFEDVVVNSFRIISK